MKFSENYHLYLPEGSDFVSPEQFNGNFTELDKLLKAVDKKAEDAATSVGEHEHSAGEITPGTFTGAYGFNAAAGESIVKLTSGGEDSVARGEVIYNPEEETAAIKSIKTANRYAKLIIRSSGTLKSLLKLAVQTSQENGETSYYLFGEHNLPTISGGYTGTGVENRSISLGASPKFLILYGVGSLGTVTDMAIINNFGDADADMNGIAFLNVSSPTVNVDTLQIRVNGTRLEVGTGANENAKFFNVTGISYYYWGLKI